MLGTWQRCTQRVLSKITGVAIEVRFPLLHRRWGHRALIRKAADIAVPPSDEKAHASDGEIEDEPKTGNKAATPERQFLQRKKEETLEEKKQRKELVKQAKVGTGPT